MSNFYIGQPVRVVAADDPFGAKHVGCEAFVNDPYCINQHGESGWVGVTVNRDPWLCYRPHQLEPILPDDLESNEEIDALWEPSPVEELENAAMRKESRA